MCCHFVSILSVILMGPIAKLAKSYESLIIGRFIAGNARGIGFSSMLVVVAETSCRRRLGVFQSPFSSMMFVAAAIGAGIGHKELLGTTENWMWLICVPALPSLLYICCWTWIPETPVSLLMSGDRDKAVEILRKLRTKREVDDEIEIMQEEINEKADAHALPLMTILRDLRLRLQFFTALVIVISPQVAGIQALFMYSDFILLEAGVNEEHVTFFTVGLLLQSALAFLLYMPVQRRYGTRKVFIIGVCAIAGGFVIFTVANALHETIPAMSYVALVAMCFLLFGIQFGPQLVMFSLSSELTTAASRPTVAFWSGASFWFIGGIVSFVLPYSVEAWGAYAYIPFVVITFALIPFGIFIVPEIHNRSAAQIQNSFRKKSLQSFGDLFGLNDKKRRKSRSSSAISNMGFKGDLSEDLPNTEIPKASVTDETIAI